MFFSYTGTTPAPYSDRPADDEDDELAGVPAVPLAVLPVCSPFPVSLAGLELLLPALNSVDDDEPCLVPLPFILLLLLLVT